MRIELAWWDLDDNDPAPDELKGCLTDEVLKEWELVPNMITKLWLVSEDTPRWGALMIWCGDKPNLSDMPPNISAEIINRPPDHRIAFDVCFESKPAG
ncbi:hypothetical protein Misp06_02457 [Microbulbifer sp. NBRC 101763]|uniref:hypothetical protein n=1 Tax=Microbulbifer TaxID=48073 RepID=UPI0003702452|nr:MULTISPECIES: hypothetical protein [Microbulbifer]WHI52285.1 hypothetical protein P3339_05730 [Microbulbifer sp. MLAF003]